MTYATNSILSSCTGQARIDTPLGPLLLARTARGLAGAWFESQKHHPEPIAAPERDDDPLLGRAAGQLRRYFDGEPIVFDVALDLQGSAFQQGVWRELLAIAPGSTCTYGDIAGRLGRPSASRAVGTAVGRNPVSIIVPCHRVVGRDGALTGYAGGLERKTALLALESRHRRHAAAGQLELH